MPSLTYPPQTAAPDLTDADRLQEAWNSHRRLIAAIASLPTHAQTAIENNAAVLANAEPEDRAALGAQMLTRFKADLGPALGSLAMTFQVLAPAFSTPEQPVTAADLAAMLTAAVTPEVPAE